jgi:hypothetical protein
LYSCRAPSGNRKDHDRLCMPQISKLRYYLMQRLGSWRNINDNSTRAQVGYALGRHTRVTTVQPNAKGRAGAATVSLYVPPMPTSHDEAYAQCSRLSFLLFSFFLRVTAPPARPLTLRVDSACRSAQARSSHPDSTHRSRLSQVPRQLCLPTVLSRSGAKLRLGS